MNAPIFTQPGPQIRTAGQVNAGDKVLACWTGNFEVQRRPATVSRVNGSSIRVTIDGTDRNFALPLAGGKAFSANNCAYMIERDESKAPGESALDRAAFLQRKADRRAGWADKARARSDAKSHQFDALLGAMNGSPVLVGHHSEKRHRRDLDRVDNALRVSVEESRKAERHDARAAGLEHAAAKLERAATSGDAIEDDRAFVAAVCAEVRKLKRAESWTTCTKSGTYRRGLESQLFVRDAKGQAAQVWIDRKSARNTGLYDGLPRFAVTFGREVTPAQVAEEIVKGLRGAS